MKLYKVLKLKKYLKRLWRRKKRRDLTRKFSYHQKLFHSGSCLFCDIVGRLRFETNVLFAY